MERENYDLVIIGGGPAGLTAGIYGGRARLKTLILEKGEAGGRAHTTREIVNYPGFLSTTGPELSEAMFVQAQHFGTIIKKENVKSVSLKGNDKVVRSRRNEYHAKAVIIAGGTKARVLNIPGEQEYTGMGVGYCATCDAEFFEGQDVIVVGCGDQGIEEGMFIAKYASSVTVVVLHEEGVLDCNRQAAEKAFAHPKMHFIWNSTVREVNGDGNEVTSVTIHNEKTGETYNQPCAGIFFFVGMVPETAYLKDEIKLDRHGWILTNEEMETSVPGVFAAGDIRAKYLRQVATAVSDGAIAATAAERFIEESRDLETWVKSSSKPLVLGLWNPEIPNSLNKLNELRKTVDETSVCFVEIDISRKKYIAGEYGVTLTEELPAVLVNV